ncbi:ribonuclease H-like domain-containing protein [Phyllosticta capitalensis]
MGDDQIKTSQRAELLAAYEGLELALDEYELNRTCVTDGDTGCKTKNVAILTDSEYVVKGITEWLPKWKSNGFRTSTGKQPSNLDLFLRIDHKVREYESDVLRISFRHIPRHQNKLADKLAKEAAEIDQEQSKLL